MIFQRGRVTIAVVLSHKAYDERIGLAGFCPIASKAKGYLFEVVVAGAKINGSVLSDQIKSLDWNVRNVEFIEKLDDALLEEVLMKFRTLIE